MEVAICLGAGRKPPPEAGALPPEGGAVGVREEELRPPLSDAIFQGPRKESERMGSQEIGHYERNEREVMPLPLQSSCPLPPPLLRSSCVQVAFKLCSSCVHHYCHCRKHTRPFVLLGHGFGLSCRR